MFRILFPLSALLVFTSVARAQFGLPGASASSVAELTAEVKTIAPGATFSASLKLDHPDGWHSYYQNSGGVELAPAIRWTLPEGFTAGPVQWPVPKVKDGFFGKSFIFTGSPVFLTNITAPAGLEPGKTVTLAAAASWQICKESCINEEKSLSLTLATGPALEMDPAAAALFAKARASQPAKPGHWKFSARPDGGEILLRVEPAGALENEPADFIPDQPFVKSVSSGGSIRRDGKALLIRLPRATRDALDNDIPQGDAISGVLTGTSPVAVPLTVIASGAASQAPASLPFAKFLPILGGMLLGGLILNLMPCVFPVIGLKIMGFVQQAGSDRKKIALHGIIFTLGVLASFGVLSGILFATRASTGWGYQLQDPWVVVTLMLLMFVLALNMYGVFEMGTSATSVGGSLQSKQGLAGSFFSGVLATVVATPCSGPFLGVAIGAAFALPALQFFSAFAAMAIGLALPYLVLSAFPKLIDFLPRPGAWMESFKQAMSFLLFATAAYLLWVYGGLIDLENLLGPMFGLSAIAIAAWIHGRWNLPHRARSTRMIARGLTLAFATGGLFLAKPPQPSAITWEPWSEARVDALLEQGTPVYIDFTAQWCATCQVNKKRAYPREVVALMRKKGVVALKADKTKPNPRIEAALQKLGRSAIPVNVLLAPGKEPVVLPELLAPDDVIKALESL
ncbi:MAG: protein-disulfide reductase DsbD family protein [Luteolibacter sp.]|jgi:thiol:disulfide interchange protein DsbD|nr:protein-disulfide reductase DsbD family protein [Luteolibacter sp.]